MVKKKYCYLLPDFPEKAYVMIPLFILNINVDIFPLHKISKSLNEISDYMLDFKKEMGKRFKDLEVSENCAIFPITFESLYPLKREFWENPSVEYKYEERKHLFLELASIPLAHKILITPSDYSKKDNSWEFSATLPIKIGTPNKAIEQFMFSSDATVNELASHAAIYIVGEGYKLNWKTKKVEMVKPLLTPVESLN